MRRFAAIPAHPQKQYTRRWRLYHFCGFYYPIREVIPIAIYHWNIGIVSRGKGKSAVAAAAYRSGEKLTNEWDGMTHDYTRKGGVVHTEIMLPPHAPPSFSDRSTLWNSVELYEKAGNAQLAREIDAALPIELSREEQIRLVREYCSSQFVSRGMCVDFVIHDTNSGNPHCHIMLTMRPLDERGAWAAKSKKEYDLDENGERIRLPSGRYKNFTTLLEMINASEAREDDETFKNPVDVMFDELEARDPDHFAVKQYRKYKLAAGVVCSKRLLNQAVGKSLRTHNLKPKKGAQVMRKNEKITALYERLSRDDFGKDDDQQRESNSISNQKAMLEEFAARQGFTNIVHFTDDGISGTCFDRPGFLAMMKEVEAGNVEYLCIKDMSRMGRDYLKVGQIMEILRQRGVRLIAINDGVDSARGDDDFTPFRNIMNEYYARDTSRKIRSTFQSKGKSGKHLTGTVIYGYLWNEARDQWLVDPEAADVVKRIFAMTIDGYGPYQIASKLKEEKVLIPSAYLAQHGEGVNKNMQRQVCGKGA